MKSISLVDGLFESEARCIVFCTCSGQKAFYLIPVHTCTLDDGSRYSAVAAAVIWNTQCPVGLHLLPLDLLKYCVGVLLAFHEDFKDSL